jgi:hypothetical protein
VIHYHGGPITPESCARRAWRQRHAFVSFAHPRQIDLAAAVCQSFALDNGAFSLWKAGKATDWPAYYEWAERWLRHPACDWAVIPDVIEGTEAENDALVREWPLGFAGVPVWHLNESIERLVRLADDWPRVALGSAAEYDVSRPSACLARLDEALARITDSDGYPVVKLHGLRMLNPAITQRVPLASADSTNVARNIGMDGAWRGGYQPATKEARTDVLIERIEWTETPGVWVETPTQADLFDFALLLEETPLLCVPQSRSDHTDGMNEPPSAARGASASPVTPASSPTRGPEADELVEDHSPASLQEARGARKASGS